MKSAEQLRQELKEAEERERQEREEQRRAFKVRFRYTIHPTDPSRWDKVYDPTCALYELRRACLNASDARAAGYSEHDLRVGGMTYLFNKVTGKIVCSIGGGTSYISPLWSQENDGADDQAFEAIGHFLTDTPNGGDITQIVEHFLATRASQKA